MSCNFYWFGWKGRWKMCWYNAQPIDKNLIVVAIGNVIHTWLNNMWCLVELEL